MGKNTTIICIKTYKDLWIEGHSYLCTPQGDDIWEIETEKGTIKRPFMFFTYESHDKDCFRKIFRYKRYDE